MNLRVITRVAWFTGLFLIFIYNTNTVLSHTTDLRPWPANALWFPVTLGGIPIKDYEKQTCYNAANASNPNCNEEPDGIPSGSGDGCTVRGTHNAAVSKASVDLSSGYDFTGCTLPGPVCPGPFPNADSTTLPFPGLIDPISQATCNPAVGAGSPNNCGPQPTLQRFFINNTLFFRIRINGDPRNKEAFSSDIWHIGIDTNQDGKLNWSIQVNGAVSGGTGQSAEVDNVVVYKVNNQNVLPFAPSNIKNLPNACTTGQNAGAVYITDACHSSSPSACAGSHTRVVNTNDNDGKTASAQGAGSNPDTDEYWIDIQIPLTAFHACNGSTNPCTTQGCQQLNVTDTIGILASTAASNRDPFQKDISGTCLFRDVVNDGACAPTEIDTCDFSDIQAVPVTLSYFNATNGGGYVSFEWETLTESANLGFNLYENTPQGKQILNSKLIPSYAVDSLEPLYYTFESEGSGYYEFYISDVSTSGTEKFHGPFSLDEPFGIPSNTENVDLDYIKSENEQKSQVRDKKIREEVKQKISVKGVNKKSSSVNTTSSTHDVATPGIDLLVSKDGLYRVSYSDLAGAGFDLNGVAAGDIALTNLGSPVPIYVHSPNNIFGPGSYIDFYGTAIDTLYSKTNVYKLIINSDLALRAEINSKSNKSSSSPEASYIETIKFEKNSAYSFSSPTKDPWYDLQLLSFTPNPVSQTVKFEVDNIAGSGGTLVVGVWGVTNFSASPDHNIEVQLNGSKIAERFFDGLVDFPITIDLNSSNGQLLDGQNELKLTLPGNKLPQTVAYDLVNYDNLVVKYPRKFVAKDGVLNFNAKGNLFVVNNFLNPDVVLYSVQGMSLIKHTAFEVSGSNGSFSIKFSGDKSKDTKYLVYNTGSLIKPGLRLSSTDTMVNEGDAQYLIISHPNFIEGLDALVEERQKTYSVKVVNVSDIYDIYSFGILDPNAIRSYIKYAAQNLGTVYVLLVGNDTYDYFNYLGVGSVSFIPTLYAKTHQVVNYSPADALYVDLDKDNVQDLAIGRFPVRTSAELQYIIDKTLNFHNAGHDKKAVFAADIDDGPFSFSSASDDIIQNLPPEWTVDTVYLEDFTSASLAKAELIQILNEGREFTSYIGHSGPTIWGTQNIFDTNDASALINDPTVVMQSGCWNSYFVHPTLNTLSHKFLLSGENGAVIVLGPASLTLAANNISIARQISEKLLVDGLTVGYALNDAKKEIAISGVNSQLDVIIGWHLLGDPALSLEH